MRERDEACNDPDHAAINAERGESRGLRQAWVALDDKRQELEQELRTARNLADSAMWEADRLRSKLEKLERERDEAQRLLAAAKESLNAIRLLAAAKESLNAIHVEVGGWIAAMMKEGK
jgi:chromosome segregation ATPase